MTRALKTLAHHAIAHPIAGLLWVLGLDAAAEWLHAALPDPDASETAHTP